MHDDECEWMLQGFSVLVRFIGYFFLKFVILNW